MFNIMKVTYNWLLYILLYSAVLGMVACSSGNNGAETNVNPLNLNVITAFALNDNTGIIKGDRISVTVPYGTDITNLVATFTTTGQYVTVGGGTGAISVIQTSGVTQNNFENSVIYTVHAANGITNNYTVIVTIAAPIYSYIIEHDNDAVVKCLVKLDGSLSKCVDSGATNISFPAGIASNKLGSYIYVTNQGTDTVTKCNVSESGNLSGCVDSGATGLAIPNSIAFNESGKYAYIVNQILNDTVSKCSVTESGSLSECVDSGANGLSFPINIVLNGSYAYITDLALDQVIQCIVAPNGDLSGCSNSGAIGFSSPINIVFNNLYAYITSYQSDVVIQCIVNRSNGNLSECRDSGASDIQVVKGIAFNLSGTVAYITNFDANSVTVCFVNAVTGSLDKCTNSGATNIVSPLGIMLYQFGNRGLI